MMRDNCTINQIVLGDFNPKEGHVSRKIGKRSFLAVTNNNVMRLVSVLWQLWTFYEIYFKFFEQLSYFISSRDGNSHF